MTNKFKLSSILTISFSVLILLSCGEGTYNNLTASEITTIEDYVMSSYFLQRGDATLADSRTAWNALETKYQLSFPAAGATTTAKRSNYPENGQVTNVTINPVDGQSDIYKVECITTYPKREDSIIRTVESYYIRDTDTDGIYTIADNILNDSYENDSNYRIEYFTEYSNDTVRYEQVMANTYDNSSDIHYAAFDIDGSLDFPEPETDGSWSPDPFTGTADETALVYSSMVSYIQEEGSPLEFWSEYKLIIGNRYYTETPDGNKTTATSVSYERVFQVDAFNFNMEVLYSYLTENYDDIYRLSGLPGITLSETVIRSEVSPNSKKKIVNTRTKIVDYNDESTIVTFEANYEMNDDGVVIKTGIPIATY